MSGMSSKSKWLSMTEAMAVGAIGSRLISNDIMSMSVEDLNKEYELIKQKKSNLSANKRNMVPMALKIKSEQGGNK